jgi:hypothetical protein
VQKEPRDGRVEVVGDGVAVQVYTVDPTPRHARHLAEQRDDRLVAEVVREERAHHVVERARVEGHPQGVCAHGRDFRELARLFENPFGRALVQLQPDQPRPHPALARPARRLAQKLARARAHVQHRELARAVPLYLRQHGAAQRARVAEPAVDPPQLDHAALVLVGRVVALVQMLKLVAAPSETLEHKRAGF